jgi:hypothetical protein
MLFRFGLLLCLFFAIATPSGARGDAPATRPANKGTDARTAQKLKVDVSIDVIGPVGSDWVGQALNQGIIGGISQESAQRFEVVNHVPTVMPDGSRIAGFFVDCVCQVANDQIRIDGNVTRLENDDPIGRFRMDGNMRDLFSVEDALSEKVIRILSAANDGKIKDASPANQPTTKPAAAATPAALPDLGSNRFSGADVPRYFDGDLSEILNPPARFQDQADRYFNSQPVYPFSYPCYIYSPFVGGGYFGGFIGGSVGNFEPTFGPD